MDFNRKIIRSFYNGSFYTEEGTKTLEIFSPLDGMKIADYVFTSLDSFDKIVQSAKKAQKKWGAMTFKKRSAILYKYRDLVIKHQNELARLIHIDNGKTLIESQGEVGKVIELIEFACSIPQLISGETQWVSNGIIAREERRPLGVVGIITPFNFPLMVPNWSIPNAIATGNAVILKSSEQTPLATTFMGDLFKEAGLPNGIFNMVNGDKNIVLALTKHPDIKAITFVGSTKIAKSVYQSATSENKRVLALGGAKNHVFAIKDAPVDSTSTQILSSAIGMAGQRCMAQSVLLVVDDQQELMDKMIKKAKAYKLGYDFPPLVSKESIIKLKSYIKFAKDNGAKILVDGSKAVKPIETKPDLSKSSSLPDRIGPGGYWFGPTLIDWTEVPEKLGANEVFGPILEIIKTKNISEALSFQNKSNYGNSSSVFTSSGKIAKEIVEKSHGGMIGVNIGVPVPREPFSFGGQRGSKFGFGDITGKSSLNFWTKLIKVTTKWDAENFSDWMS